MILGKMLFYRLILSGIIVMYKNSLYNTVSSQDVSMILPRTAVLLLEKLKFGCSPSQTNMWGSVTHISLAQNTSNGFQNIVTVLFDFKTFRNATTWSQTDWQHRATVIREFVNPVMSSTGLEFDIQSDRVLCSDEGTYRCKVIGSSADKNHPLEEVKIGTLKFRVLPTTINQIQISPKPEMDETYNPYTLIQLSCTGTVGAPSYGLRWCFRRENNKYFQGWLDDRGIDQGPIFPQGCQNSQTSTLRYNVSADFQYTEFRCETGYENLICGHPRSISSNITIYKYTVPTQTIYVTTECSSEMEKLLLGCTAILSTVMIIGFIMSITLYKKGMIVIKWKKERIYADTMETTTEHAYDSTTDINMYDTV